MKAGDGSARLLPHLEAVRAGLDLAGPHPDPLVDGAQPGGAARECRAAAGHFKIWSLPSLASDNCLLVVCVLHPTPPMSVSRLPALPLPHSLCCAASYKLSLSLAAASIEQRASQRAYR